MKSRLAIRNLLPGGLGLALVALGTVPSTPVRAQEQVKERPKERPKEAPRENPRPAPPAAQEPAPHVAPAHQAPANPAPPGEAQPAKPARPAPPSATQPGPHPGAQPPVPTPAQPVKPAPQPGAQAPAPTPAQPVKPTPQPGAQAPAPTPAPPARPAPQPPVSAPAQPAPARPNPPGIAPGSAAPGAGAPIQRPTSHPNVPTQWGAHPGAPAQGPGPHPGPAAQGPGPRPGPAPVPGPAAQGREPHPVTIVRTPGGGEIHRGPGGAVREVHTPAGAVIRYAPDGVRHVESARPDGRVVFANGNGRDGYVQRPIRVHDQVFVQRTYVERGVTSTRVYRPYVYRGVTYHVYMPSHYYRPAYYSWAYRPWREPVRYRWGWNDRPWYGYYHGYYAPYPYYASPLFWLTDFMLAFTLESAYEARMDNASAPPPPPPPMADNGGLTPEVKQAIADEVRRQVDEERAEQQASAQGYAQPDAAPPLFSQNVSRIFLVYTSTLAYAGGQERFLSEGDVLQLQGAPPPNSAYAEVQVLASRDPGVPRGSWVSVSLMDLQEMQNHMRAGIDRGLGDLQSRQGQDGLPPLPAQARGGSDAPYASGLQPDANAATELSQVAQEADSSGQTMLYPSPQGAADAPSNQTLSLGMTESEVRALLGNPRETANVGARKIVIYPNFKITYTNGRVTDIQ